MNLQRLAGILETKDKKRSILFAFYVRLTDVSVKGLPAMLFKKVFILLMSAEHKRYQTQEVIRISYESPIPQSGFAFVFILKMDFCCWSGG